jgi:hypothetical protein
MPVLRRAFGIICIGERRGARRGAVVVAGAKDRAGASVTETTV